jgi:hypothetical protein
MGRSLYLTGHLVFSSVLKSFSRTFWKVCIRQSSLRRLFFLLLSFFFISSSFILIFFLPLSVFACRLHIVLIFFSLFHLSFCPLLYLFICLFSRPPSLYLFLFSVYGPLSFSAPCLFPLAFPVFCVYFLCLFFLFGIFLFLSPSYLLCLFVLSIFVSLCFLLFFLSVLSLIFSFPWSPSYVRSLFRLFISLFSLPLYSSASCL